MASCSLICYFSKVIKVVMILFEGLPRGNQDLVVQFESFSLRLNDFTVQYATRRYYCHVLMVSQQKPSRRMVVGYFKILIAFSEKSELSKNLLNSNMTRRFPFLLSYSILKCFRYPYVLFCAINRGFLLVYDHLGSEIMLDSLIVFHLKRSILDTFLVD